MQYAQLELLNAGACYLTAARVGFCSLFLEFCSFSKADLETCLRYELIRATKPIKIVLLFNPSEVALKLSLVTEYKHRKSIETYSFFFSSFLHPKGVTSAFVNIIVGSVTYCVVKSS